MPNRPTFPSSWYSCCKYNTFHGSKQQTRQESFSNDQLTISIMQNSRAGTVGTHSSCVRSNNHASVSSFTLGGRTDRASLYAIPAMLTFNLTHIMLLFHPFCTVVPPILRANMSHIVSLALISSSPPGFILYLPSFILLPLNLVLLFPVRMVCEPMNVFFCPALCKDTKFCKRLQDFFRFFYDRYGRQCFSSTKVETATTAKTSIRHEQKRRRRR